MADEMSIYERLARLMVELKDFDVKSDDPRRFAYWKMRNAAWAALDQGSRTAAEILDAMRAMRSVEQQTASDANQT